TGLFGTGAGTFRATQDLMLLAGLPPLVRNGDRFGAEVTLRNASAHAMEVVARAQVDGLGTALEPRGAPLAPRESRTGTRGHAGRRGAGVATRAGVGDRGGRARRPRRPPEALAARDLPAPSADVPGDAAPGGARPADPPGRRAAGRLDRRPGRRANHAGAD